MKAKRKPILITLVIFLTLTIAATCATFLTTKAAISHPEKKRFVPATLGLFLTSRALLNLIGFMSLILLTAFYACGGMFVQGSRALGKDRFQEFKAWRMKLYMEGMPNARPDISPRVMSLYRRGYIVDDQVLSSLRGQQSRNSMGPTVDSNAKRSSLRSHETRLRKI